MVLKDTTQPQVTSRRLVSLDVMRGVIMVLLAAESCFLYEALHEFQFGGIAGIIINEFFHADWHGLNGWDLVQPAFMLMAGSAMYLSYYYKTQKGISWGENFKHIAIRCFKLFFWGVALYCIQAGRIVWELWNVLVQLSVTTIIAYLIINKTTTYQLLVTAGLLLLTEVLYRYTNIPGFNEAFTIHKNFGSYMDYKMMGKLNPEGWVAINFIPTAAHTIWGVLAGRLLVKPISDNKKIIVLVIAGIIGLVLGFGLDMANITPIIKKISTSSFTLASGGWVLLILAFLYWLVDIKKWNRYAWIFVVVGMNSIFIYILFSTLGYNFLNKAVGLFPRDILDWLGASTNVQAFFAALATLFVEWYICYWLYKRKIFFKL